MKLETERQGRWLARRVLFKLGRAGTEACRADDNGRAQSGALRCALFKLMRQGTREAHSGFACVLTDALGTRGQPGELAHLYERMETDGRFRQWRNDSADKSGDNVPEVTKAETPPRVTAFSPSLQIAPHDRRPLCAADLKAEQDRGEDGADSKRQGNGA